MTYAVNTSAHNLIEESVNGSTYKPEQQNSEYYNNYDPSIGVNTAAVLGGILLWLVLYVIYRTKIRKFIIRAVKQKFETISDLSPKKVHDSDLNSSSGTTNRNTNKPLINPSIVIETSPPESSPKSPSTYDQFFKPGGVNDCLSPYSYPGGIIPNEDGMVFQFPCVHNHHSPYQVSDQPDGTSMPHNIRKSSCYAQLPKSEVDIPSATAQWVQSMPLAARSYHDFTGFMTSIHNRGYLSMNKPGSCPHVCSTPESKVPVLEIPSAWNNSLPLLPNLSNKILSAYDSPLNSHKDIKELINAKRKLSHTLNGEREYNFGWNVTHVSEKRDSNRRSNKKKGTDKNEQRQSNAAKKKTSKNPANLTIKIPDSRDTATGTLINNTAYSRSPVPIPVTPTVMIQNSTKAPDRRRGCHDSNTSISSSSSNDLIPTVTNLPPPIHITAADPSQNCYHFPLGRSEQLHHSPSCPQGNWETNSNSSFHNRIRPSYSNPNDLLINYCQCPLKHSNTSSPCRLGSAGDVHLSRKQNNDDSNSLGSPVFHHRRTRSDYNHRHHHLNPASPSSHQRSHSADISAIYGAQHDRNNPIGYSSPHSGNSALNSPGPLPQSPNFLQVPDVNSGIDFQSASSLYSSNSSLCHSSNNNYNNHSSNSNSNTGRSGSGNGTQFGMRYASTSDSNIAYYSNSRRPISPLVDIPQDRRHSSIVPESTANQLLFCSDGNSRPRSASYFLPLQAMAFSTASASASASYPAAEPAASFTCVVSQPEPSDISTVPQSPQYQTQADTNYKSCDQSTSPLQLQQQQHILQKPEKQQQKDEHHCYQPSKQQENIQLQHQHLQQHQQQQQQAQYQDNQQQRDKLKVLANQTKSISCGMLNETSSIQNLATTPLLAKSVMETKL